MTAPEVRQHTRPCDNCSCPPGPFPTGWRTWCCWNPTGCDCLDAPPPDKTAAYPNGLRFKTAALRQLCADRQAEDVNGGQTDAEPIWPSEILAILDARQLR